MHKLLFSWHCFTLLSICHISGCGTVCTEQPLSNVGAVVTDKALVGVWNELDDSVVAEERGEKSGVQMTVSLLKDDTYQIVIKDDQDDEEGLIIGRCFEIQGMQFFTPTSIANKRNGESIELPAEENDGFGFISVARKGRFLLVRMPDADAFAKLIDRSDQLEGTASGWISKSVLISSEPSVVAQQIIRHQDILFKEPVRFRLETNHDTDDSETKSMPVPQDSPAESCN